MKVKEDTRKVAQARRPYTSYDTRQAFYQAIGGIILSQIGQVTGLQVGYHFHCTQAAVSYRCASLVVNVHPDYLGVFWAAPESSTLRRAYLPRRTTATLVSESP